MTSLPSSNNIWIIFLIGGVFLILLGFSKQDENFNKNIEYTLELRKANKEYEKFNEYLTTIKTNYDSIKVLKRDYQKSELINNLITKLNNEIDYLQEKYDTDKSKIEERLELALIDYELGEEIYSMRYYEYFIAYILGTIFFTIGIVKIYQNQSYRDKLLYSQYLGLKVSVQECQSCGMLLEDDLNFDNNSNFCSYCFDGNKFNHSELNLEEFKEIVKTQLILNGFNENKIKSHLKKLSNLRRWKTKFNWKK